VTHRTTCVTEPSSVHHRNRPNYCSVCISARRQSPSSPSAPPSGPLPPPFRSRPPPLPARTTTTVTRRSSYHRRGLFAIKAKNGGAFPKAAKPAAAAEPKFYPADDVKLRTVSTRKPKPTKLRCVMPPVSLDPVRKLYADIDLVCRSLAGLPSRPGRC
jgi:hypothetical protein